MKIAHHVGGYANRRLVKKHFDITFTDTSFTWRRRRDNIDRAGRFNGIYGVRIYVARTSLTDTATNTPMERARALPAAKDKATTPNALTALLP